MKPNLNYSLTVSATHILRLYLWDKLKTYMGDSWKPIPTGGGKISAIPIIPVQEQPEVQTSENPYIVYAYDVAVTTDLWQLQNETSMFTIYSQSPATIASTTRLMQRLFNKWDESAQDVNRWIRSEDGLGKFSIGDSEYDQWIDEVKNFKFRFIRVAGVLGTDPATQEAGRLNSSITIESSFIERDMRIENNNK